MHKLGAGDEAISIRGAGVYKNPMEFIKCLFLKIKFRLINFWPIRRRSRSDAVLAKIHRLVPQTYPQLL
jgi:hypothetical protein